MLPMSEPASMNGTTVLLTLLRHAEHTNVTSGDIRYKTVTLYLKDS